MLFEHTRRLRAGKLSLEPPKDRPQYAWYRKRDRTTSRQRKVGILEFKEDDDSVTSEPIKDNPVFAWRPGLGRDHIDLPITSLLRGPSGKNHDPIAEAMHAFGEDPIFNSPERKDRCLKVVEHSSFVSQRTNGLNLLHLVERSACADEEVKLFRRRFVLHWISYVRTTDIIAVICKCLNLTLRNLKYVHLK